MTKFVAGIAAIVIIFGFTLPGCQEDQPEKQVVNRIQVKIDLSEMPVSPPPPVEWKIPFIDENQNTALFTPGPRPDLEAPTEWPTYDLSLFAGLDAPLPAGPEQGESGHDRAQTVAAVSNNAATAENRAADKSGDKTGDQPERTDEKTGKTEEKKEGPSFTILAASFYSREAAEEGAKRLAGTGYKSVIKEEKVGRGTYYLLFHGRFDDYEKARRFAWQLKRNGDIKDFYIRKITEP